MDPLCPAGTSWSDEYPHPFSGTDTWPKIASAGGRVFMWTGETERAEDDFRIYAIDGTLLQAKELPPFVDNSPLERQARMLGVDDDGFVLMTQGFFPGVELMRVDADLRPVNASAVPSAKSSSGKMQPATSDCTACPSSCGTANHVENTRWLRLS
jgi:hypothetical protein